jgi:hypothetical protein
MQLFKIYGNVETCALLLLRGPAGGAETVSSFSCTVGAKFLRDGLNTAGCVRVVEVHPAVLCYSALPHLVRYADVLIREKSAFRRLYIVDSWVSAVMRTVALVRRSARRGWCGLCQGSRRRRGGRRMLRRGGVLCCGSIS